MTIDDVSQSSKADSIDEAPARDEQWGDANDNWLVGRARDGDSSAYAELWRRHASAGRNMAMSMTSLDPDDLVAESFTKIYAAIQRGGGPKTGFRSYLFATIRNTAAQWGRASREVSTEDVDVLGEVESSEEQALRNLDRTLSGQAFTSLPPRWQEALWYSEVERLPHEEIARILGIKVNAVAVLTYRAREGMRRAWINAYLSSESTNPDCQWTIKRLAGYARKSTTARETKRIEEHLAQCPRCSRVAEEAKDLGHWLPLLLLGPIVGTTAAALYAASVREAAVATSAMATGPMPAGVTAAPAGTLGRSALRRARKHTPRGISSTTGGVASTVVILGLLMAGLVAFWPHSTTHPLPEQVATKSPAFSASLLMGAGDLFLPGARGTGEPGARVTASQGSLELASTTVERDGRWSIIQVDAAASGTIDFALSGADGKARERVALDYALAVPELTVTVEGERTSIAVTGLPKAPIQVLLDKNGSDDRSSSLVAATLNAVGTGTWTFSLPDSAGATIGVRYAAGDRFGVTVTE